MNAIFGYHGMSWNSSREKEKKDQCVGDTTPTPAYLLQYSAVARSSLSANDDGTGPGRYDDWRGGEGNGLREGIEGVLSGDPILGMFARSG
jgi:hypothetical protein